MSATTCGNCHAPEAAHEGRTPEEAAIMRALLTCPGFAVSRAAVATVKAAGRLGRRRRSVFCGRCGQQGHAREACPW